jgi:sRNA-binding carbon storage regulator CsrA
LLILNIDKDESIVIGEGEFQAVVTNVRMANGKFRIGIHTARHIPVHRAVVYEAIHHDEMVTPQGVIRRVQKPSMQNIQRPEED